MAQVNIPYESRKHLLIKDALKDRIALSREKMSQRYSDWEKNEERFLAYLPETNADALRRGKRNTGYPQLTRLEIPYSYAVALTAHTYWTSVFLSRNPVFQLSARHGEPQMAVQAMEALLDYQLNVGGMQVPLYIWLLDPAKYGFGVVGTYWDEESVVVSRVEEEQATYLGIPIDGKTVKRRVTERIPGYKGNRLYNVRPQDFFPDPRVPISRLQDGEFVGRYVEVSWNTVLKKAAANQYFNITELKNYLKSRQQSEREQGSSQITLPDAKDDMAIGPPPISMGKSKEDRPYVSMHEIYVELVPNEWQLGPSDYPEKWVFTLAEDAVIIGAQPLGLYHNKFPFFIQEYEPDGYSLFSRSMIEVMDPLQNTLSWLINTHLQSVRKAINDMFVVDPSKIMMKDITDPKEGKLIRLKPEYYGTNPADAVHQLQVVDITQNHLRDANIITDLIQRVTGVTDNIMGLQDPGGRKTATEVRTSSGFGINRLKTNAEYMSAMGWHPLISALVQTTQQKYDGDQQFKIAGNLVSDAQRFMQVNPEDIAGFFDYVPVDGTLPVDRFAQANLIRQFIGDIGGSPQLAQRFDVVGLLTHAMQLMGMKNIKQFDVQVVPDQQMQQQVQDGNSVSLNSALGDRAGLAGQQIEGMGPLG